VTIAPPTDLAPRIASLNPDDFAVPSGREEEWRFVPIERAQVFFEKDPDASSVHADSSDVVRMVPANEVDDGWLPTDRAAAIARANVQHAIRIDIPANAEIAEPVVVALRNAGQMNYLHLSMDIGAHSDVTIIVLHDVSSDVSGAIVTKLGDGARATVVHIVDGGRGRQMLHWYSSLGRDAKLTGASVLLDGSLVRITPRVTYSGPGGDCEMLGVFLADGQHFFEQRIFVEHEAPHCRSNVVYKGALAGSDAHTVWVGDVLVRRTAIGTDTYEMNRNLLLNDGPRADSVPNLELETGDVASAGHASATGRFDDLQLFYLMSRGITEEQARQMVVRGFFADVIRRIPSPEWQTKLFERVDRRLGISGASDE
jgi:Fe-S cluster assembly protein SufD